MRIGIDLGGTKTEGIVLSQDNQVLERIRISTPQQDGYQAIIENIVNLVKQLEDSVNKECTVGIGTPGSVVKRTGLLKYSNTVCLNDKPLLADLEKTLDRRIRIENDANCFALSEAIDGAGQGYDSVFGIIMGTGVGGGIIINQKILSGPNGMTGEWGHNVLNPNGNKCYCGQDGCVETYLSGPGLLNQHKLNGGDEFDSVEQLLKLSESGDSIANKTLEDFYDHFAHAISYIIKVLDPDVIVLGGGLSNIQQLYTNTSNRISNYFSKSIIINIVQNIHGDSSGVRGAAFLWDQK